VTLIRSGGNFKNPRLQTDVLFGKVSHHLADIAIPV
jgi:hypothetical protein